MMYTLPAGGYDQRKHATLADCAAAEMNEEVRRLYCFYQHRSFFQAQLIGGELVPLLPLDLPGIPESKWCANRFHPFLCIDPRPDPNPPPRDAEEFMEVWLYMLTCHHSANYACHCANESSRCCVWTWAM